MNAMHDLLIHGATVFDGLGNPGVTADVAVANGRIAAIGRIDGPARERVDAHGLALAPGIVDLHTHYDAQVTWDPTLSPSPSLGVTTVVIGNCGFGIAPCPPALRDTLLANLSVVEGMDLDVLRTATRWEFESFAEYLALVARAKPYANVAVFAQHSTIRTAVMGEDASRRAPTGRELAAMKHEVEGAIAAGAIGFASSFSPNHTGHAGAPMPSTIASDEELLALAGVLGEAGRGVLMMATGPRATPEFMEAFARASGRPAFISTVLTMYSDAAPQRGLGYYGRCAAALARGHEVYIQTSCQPLAFDFTLRDPYLLYSHDAFDRVKRAEGAGLAAIYGDPTFRAAFRANLASPKSGILFTGNWRAIEIAESRTNGLEGRSIAALAEGRDPLDVFFDVALADELDTTFVAKCYNNDDDGVEPLVRHPAGVISLSDAGAHLKFLCDAGYGLHLLGHWVRERKAFTLAEGIRRLTSDPAVKYRIPDRGRIEVGACADLFAFDPATVSISKSMRVRDLPGGGTRLIRKPIGVAGVWVNGVRVFDGEDYVPLAAGPGQVLDRFGA